MKVSATGFPRKLLSDSGCPNWLVSVKSAAGGRLLTIPASLKSRGTDLIPGMPYFAAAKAPTISKAINGMTQRAQRIHDGSASDAGSFRPREDALLVRFETAMGRAQEPCWAPA